MSDMRIARSDHNFWVEWDRAGDLWLALVFGLRPYRLIEPEIAHADN